MKHRWGWIAVGTLGLALCPSAAGDAALTGDVTLTVTIQSLSMTITGNPSWAIGAITPGTVVTQTNSQRAVVQNNGNVHERFTLQVTNAGGTWAVSGDATAGADEFVMGGVFGASGDSVTSGNFNESTGNEDVIQNVVTSSSATVFGSAGASANGASVAPTNSVGLWLQFKAPTSSSVSTQQSVTTTVGVEAA